MAYKYLQGYDRLIYVYLHTTITSRLEEIREITKDIESTPLQSTPCFQNNHEISFLESHILLKISFFHNLSTGYYFEHTSTSGYILLP